VIVEYLEALERGDIPNLIVEMPPRHSKTYHVSQRFPAWYLGRHPQRDVVLASYSALLAIESSREVRRPRRTRVGLSQRREYPANPRRSSVGR
jgi:hypothetical protein